ncbi:hypothetical protein [Spirosoma koreense]
MNDQLNKFIEEISEELTYDYFANSFGDPRIEAIRTNEIFSNTDLADKFLSKDKQFQSCRNILIIGAGASSDAYAGIPIGSQMIEELEKEYVEKIKTIPFLADRYRQEEEEIKKLTGNQLDFENYLYLLSSFFVKQDDLRKKITEMTGFRNSPNLFYEITAHMLKHGFIDAIINFNFEELLDQAISEEIGEGNYHYILSDGHAVKLSEILVDGRLKAPIYIKPHGTHSHKTSLRFTKRHYLDLPEDIRLMLKSIIGGERGAGYDSIRRVNVICVGFKMESFELNEIIDQYLPPYSKIYHISRSEINETDLRKLFKSDLPSFYNRANASGRFNRQNDTIDNTDDQALENYREIFRSFSTNKFCSDNLENTLTSPLGQIFSTIWREIYNNFKPSYRPRSIARHEIISYLFYRYDLGARGKKQSIEERQKQRQFITDTYEKNYEYFCDRTLVEIALAIIRNNGIIDLIEILLGRVGIYYQAYRNAFTKSSATKQSYSLYELVNEFATPGDIPQADQQSNEEFQYARNIFEVKSLAYKNDDLAPEQTSSLNKNWQTTKIINSENKNITGYKFAKNLHESIIRYRKNKAVEEPILSVMFHLFASDKLSNIFKENFLNNHSKEVFSGRKANASINGLSSLNQDLINDNRLLAELFRSLQKSFGSHYYYINSNHQDPKHFIWESFQKKKVLHTNLALRYEYKEAFLHKKWDILLCVSETGGLSGFLNKKFDSELNGLKPEHKRQIEHVKKELLLGKRRMIFIGSYEAVKMLHPGSDGADLIRAHKKRICGSWWKEECVDVLLMPSWQHHNHVTVFLEKESLSDYYRKDNLPVFRNNDFSFKAVSSLYTYRRGFSNSIDPILLSHSPDESNHRFAQRDHEKLLSLFFTYVCRCLVFEGSYNLSNQNNQSQNKTWPKNKLIFKGIQANAYKAWNGKKFREQLELNFLKNIYKILD